MIVVDVTLLVPVIVAWLIVKVIAVRNVLTGVVIQMAGVVPSMSRNAPASAAPAATAPVVSTTVIATAPVITSATVIAAAPVITTAVIATDLIVLCLGFATGQANTGSDSKRTSQISNRS